MGYLRTIWGPSQGHLGTSLEVSLEVNLEVILRLFWRSF